MKKNIIIFILAFAFWITGTAFVVNHISASKAPCAEINTNTSITTIAPEIEVIEEEETFINTQEMLLQQEWALAIMEQFFANKISYSEAASKMCSVQESIEEEYADIIEEEAHLSSDPSRPGEVSEYFTETEWNTLSIYHYVSKLAHELESGRGYWHNSQSIILEEYTESLSRI